MCEFVKLKGGWPPEIRVLSIFVMKYWNRKLFTGKVPWTENHRVNDYPGKNTPITCSIPGASWTPAVWDMWSSASVERLR